VDERVADLDFKRQRSPPAIIGHAARRHRRFARSYRDVEGPSVGR
jgi:hypothetical protein